LSCAPFREAPQIFPRFLSVFSKPSPLKGKEANIINIMKNRIKNLILLPALTAGFGLILAGSLTAQTFTTLHSFTALSGSLYTNSDGAGPKAGLILSGNTLFGTATEAGPGGYGTVFAVNTDGTSFTMLHSFTNNGYDGDPVAGVVLSGNTLFGSMNEGGLYAKGGGLFAVNVDGTGFTNLHTPIAGAFNPQGFYCNSDGAGPLQLILSGNTLYGTTTTGGSAGYGTVFAVNTNGTGFTNLHIFTEGVLNSSDLTVNSDGLFPQAGLVLSGTTLYGTTELGGSEGFGTVFAVNTDGTGFRTVYTFTNGSDGSWPGEMTMAGNTLYGTASAGGDSGWGTVFAINTDGASFTTLHSFTALPGPFSGYYGGTNGDGAIPYAGLVLAGATLYGTAFEGGFSGCGTVFAVNTDGTDFTTLYSFSAFPPFGGGSSPPPTNSDGANPYAGLLLSGHTLYGTAEFGGDSGYGTVFSIALPVPPQPRIASSAGNVTLTWPTNAVMFTAPPTLGASFTLQACTNLDHPVWTTLQTLTATNGVFYYSEPLQTDSPGRFYRISAH
jgi:uncharacterized repeat protein (TIGR03803 family)